MNRPDAAASDAPGAERALPAAESMLLALAFSLPFCSVARLLPNPAFWGEWTAGLFFMLWLASRLWRSERGAPRQVNWLVVAFLGLAALIVVQVVLRLPRSAMEALLASGTLALAAAVCMGAGAMLQVGERQSALRAAAWGLIAALLANAVVVVMGWAGYGLISLHIVRIPAETRAVGLIGQANHLGTLAVFALLAAHYLASQRRLPVWGWVGVVLVAAITAAATGSRIAVLQWLLAALFWWWHRRGSSAEAVSSDPAYRHAIPLGALVVAQVAWAWIAPRLTDTPVTALRTGSSNRLEMLRDSVAMWLNHPWLGVGSGNFASTRLFELTGPLGEPNVNHAHNILAQALAEWGPLGLLAVVAAAAMLLRVLFRRGAAFAGPGHEFAGSVVLCLMTYSLVEHPLWFLNLLLPFAFFVGLLPLPVWATRPGAAGPVGQPARVVAVVAVVAAAGLLAADYQRSQSLAMRVAAQGIGAPDEVSPRALAEVSRIAVATFFPTEAVLLQARSLAFDPAFAEFKLAVCERALRGVPSAETMARYIAFTALAGRPAVGRALLDNLASRNAFEHAETVRILTMFATQHPLVAAMVPASGTAPAQAN